MSAKPDLIAALILSMCLAIPMASAAEDEVALGHKVFQRETCEGCHPGGDNTLDPGHPIKGDKFQAKYKDDALLDQVIRHGFPDSGMPQFSKTEINEKEMKQLIAYIRSLTPKKGK
ncbi:MAG TPA: cytochrome c [Trichormus sp.]|jgi:mono/diheme cytochrome c family protein